MGANSGMSSKIWLGHRYIALICRDKVALLDLRKNDAYRKEFEEILQSIFNLYLWSGKLTRELQSLAALLDEEFSKFVSLKTMRWSGSSFCALHKMMKMYPNLVRHLEALAASKHKHADKAKGLLPKITSVKFVKYLHYLLDFLLPCSIVSKTFQKEDILISDIPRSLNKCISSLEKLRDGNGHFMAMFGKRVQPNFEGFQRGNTWVEGPVHSTGSDWRCVSRC